MLEKLKYITKKKSFHACVMIIIISIVLFILGTTVLKYTVEGETNMPFNLSKIIIISSVEGVDKEDTGENKWAFDINQNNDIYLYIEKNKNFTRQELINKIEIDNIKIEKQSEKGTIQLYRPNTLEIGGTFSNKEENAVQKIEYVGELETNLKTLNISNQGGIIAFRYANNNIAEYQSNEEEINHAKLLKNVGIIEDELKAKIHFDLKLKIEAGKEYKATISLDVPVENLVEEGTASIEITNLKDIIFKRIKN